MTWCFRADITAVLLCTSHLLFYCCDSVAPLLDPCDADADICHVHNYCCCLLAALTVVAAPLESLYRYATFLPVTHMFQRVFPLTWISWYSPEDLQGRLLEWYLPEFGSGRNPEVLANPAKIWLWPYFWICVRFVKIQFQCYVLL